MATFEITGLKECLRALKTLAPKLEKKVLRQAIRKALKPILAKAKELAPKDKGDLAKAIKLRAAVKRKRGVIALEVRVGEGEFQGKTFYGGMQEYGTSKIQPHPFMRPAFDEGKDQAMTTAKEEILAGVEREAKA